MLEFTVVVVFYCTVVVTFNCSSCFVVVGSILMSSPFFRFVVAVTFVIIVVVCS